MTLDLRVFLNEKDEMWILPKFWKSTYQNETKNFLSFGLKEFMI